MKLLVTIRPGSEEWVEEIGSALHLMSPVEDVECFEHEPPSIEQGLTPAIAFDRTGRGFSVGTFFDRYRQECSVQDSSLATECCIWLGVDRNIPPAYGGEGKEVNARMHLTRELAANLMVVLQRFIDTGSVTPLSSLASEDKADG